MTLGDKLKKNFAKNLQLLRTEKDLTQARLAEILNEKYGSCDIDLKRTSIVNYESGAALPKMDALYCIAEYFGKTIDQMISPTMAKPLLDYKWKMLDEKNRSGSKSAKAADKERSPVEANVNEILLTCVDGILNRHFYVDFLSKLYKKLQEGAVEPEGRKKLEEMFFKTFLACQLSKSKYLNELAEKVLNEQEFEVFLAFKDSDVTIAMVGKAQNLTEEEVVAVFNNAQLKISTVLEENSKSNLS